MHLNSAYGELSSKSQFIINFLFCIKATISVAFLLYFAK
nr:MAG TPA: hypothetical protein [Caudoviricetes sp.]